MTWLYATAPTGVSVRRVTTLPTVSWYLRQERLRVASISGDVDGLQVDLDPIYAFRFAGFLPDIEIALRRRCAEMRGGAERRCELYLELTDGDGWVLRSNLPSS